MSNMLILMRHGKAQQPTEGEDDKVRKLSEAGKRSLAATLPDMLAQIPSGAVLNIWSSPAERALQTARLVQRACKACGIKTESDIREVESLWDQDFAEFMDEVDACDSSIVLAVGHNPFIEDATARISGSQIDFATGGMAALDPTGGRSQIVGTLEGRLLWFVQGPISQHWKSLVRLERVIADAAKSVQERRDAFFADPGDIETAHKLRVSIRTLRSLLVFIEPWQKRAQNKEAQADLKSIVATTSRLRELDVLTSQAVDMEGASDEFIAFCADKADAERQAVLDTLSSKRMVQRLKHVVEELEHIEWRNEVRKSGLREEEARARFDALAAKLGDDLAALDLADAEATHDVRKKAKQVRYDAERFGFLIGDDAVSIAKEMVAHQDNLGAICDARVNIGIVDELAQEDVAEPVAWDLALFRAQNATFLYQTLRDNRNVAEPALDIPEEDSDAMESPVCELSDELQIPSEQPLI